MANVYQVTRTPLAQIETLDDGDTHQQPNYHASLIYAPVEFEYAPAVHALQEEAPASKRQTLRRHTSLVLPVLSGPSHDPL